MTAAVLSFLLSSAHASHDPKMAPRTHGVDRREHGKVPARDGVRLFTAWFTPDGDGPFPTVVTRVPYPMDPLLDAQCRILARRGYACVYQHVRGRGRSDGTWTPFVHDEKDGEDLIAWIKEQPWSDQKIGWIGDSYLAAAGWTVIAEDPAGVSTIVSRMFAPSLYTTAYEDGLLRHELVTAWMSMMPDDRRHLIGPRRYHRALEHRPRLTMDEVAAGHPVPWFREWLTGEDPSAPLWNTGDGGRFERAAENTRIPVMMVGGWSDAFIEAQIDAWAALPSRENSLLVIGPWSHIGQAPSAVPLRGQRGPGGGGGLMVQYPRVLDWLDVHVKGAEPRYPNSGVVSYVIGGDRWEIRPDWPPPARERRFGAVSGADRCDGALVEGGVLSAPLTYTYDPQHPLPSRGGAGMLAGAVPMMNGVKPGFVRSPYRCERREDVLCFRSAPLSAPLHLAGTIKVELEVASDAPDTAFGFRLLERREGGPEFLLREGFATLALREGGGRTPYAPGERVRVVADGAPLEVEVHAGSELVLVITSSSFPAVEAHPNTDGLLAEATETRVARQTVFSATLVLPEVVD